MKKTKALWLFTATQRVKNKQWWSKLSTHASQRRQCLVSSGCTIWKKNQCFNPWSQIQRHCKSVFWVRGRNPMVWPIKWKLLSSTFLGGTVYYAVQGGSNFWLFGWNPKVWPFKWKLLSSTFLWYRLLFVQGGSSKSVDEILKCNHSNESYWAVVLFIFCCSHPIVWQRKTNAVA